MLHCYDNISFLQSFTSFWISILLQHNFSLSTLKSTRLKTMFLDEQKVVVTPFCNYTSSQIINKLLQGLDGNSYQNSQNCSMQSHFKVLIPWLLLTTWPTTDLGYGTDNNWKDSHTVFCLPNTPHTIHSSHTSPFYLAWPLANISFENPCLIWLQSNRPLLFLLSSRNIAN